MNDCLTIRVRGAAVGSLLLAIVLAGGCKRSPDGTAPQPQPNAGPTITANPNPVPAGTAKFGTTTISWDTGNGSLGEVYVSVNGGPEKRFSGALRKAHKRRPGSARGTTSSAFMPGRSTRRSWQPSRSPGASSKRGSL